MILVGGASTALALVDCSSRFDDTTGEVLGGPAPSPLPKVNVAISGDAILAE